jgi:predicted O-methyltransferase YrrM
VANRLFQLSSYLSYWLDATDEHSLHSPFLFDFYTRVIVPSKRDKTVHKIEDLRRKLLTDKRNIRVEDLGSGSMYQNGTIASIAATSLSPVKFSSLYSRIILYKKARQILELGTSFGVNTLYLAQHPDTRVTTLEGSSEVADIARLTFQFHGSKNINLIEGNIDDTLGNFLQSVRKIDFALIDANHRFEPTRDYFEQLAMKVHENSVIVIDDIHLTSEMERAWNALKAHRLVYTTIDLFRCGILFFDPSLNKQHVILQY